VFQLAVHLRLACAVLDRLALRESRPPDWRSRGLKLFEGAKVVTLIPFSSVIVFVGNRSSREFVTGNTPPFQFEINNSGLSHKGAVAGDFVPRQQPGAN
jgi:hypothetical protein